MQGTALSPPFIHPALTPISHWSNLPSLEQNIHYISVSTEWSLVSGVCACACVVLLGVPIPFLLIACLPDTTDRPDIHLIRFFLLPLSFNCFPLSLSWRFGRSGGGGGRGMKLQGPFSVRPDMRKGFLWQTYKYRYCLSLCFSCTYTFPGINKSFHSLLGDLQCDTGAVCWQILRHLGKKKKCFLTFLPPPHAPLAGCREKMKTNTVGFVPLQKKNQQALNLHGSSHTLPQEPVETGQRWVQTKCF